MTIGQVIGTVTLSSFEPALKGGRFLLVSPLNKAQLSRFAREGSVRMRPLSGAFAAVVYDNLGAGIDDVIGYSEGMEAASAFETPVPIDAFNTAILEKAHYVPLS